VVTILKDYLLIYNILLGYTVAQVFEALRYELEGRGFSSRWIHWDFSLT
jgi:hypothetical protein